MYRASPSTWSVKREIESLQSAQFDIVIIGGGITGACIAHDSAMRGLKVALVEKNDFGMSTSAASSKLLHGGIRYLQKLQFGKVRESARERTYFQVIAPHMTSTVPFLIPTINNSLLKGRMALSSGMYLYRALCSGLNSLITDPGKKIDQGSWYSREEALRLVPLLDAIEGLSGAHTLYESHINNSERMTLAFIKSAWGGGAVAVNHVEVTGFISEGRRITGVRCRDMLTGREFGVRATIVVNAAGPFLPRINRQIDGLSMLKETTGFSKGVHLVTRQLVSTFALALSSSKKTEGLVTRGGRHIFMIPWRNHTLIGTTNVPFEEELDRVRVTRRDIADFLQDINAIIPGLDLRETDVRYAFAGLYPLISDDIKRDTYQGTGEYQVIDHERQDGHTGIVSVLGAKYTTARAVAEQATDLLVDKLGFSTVPCRTAHEPLLEGRIADLESFIADRAERYAELLSPDTIGDLVVSHGSEIDRVMSYLQRRPGYLQKLSPSRETLVGEAAYAVEHEMARTLDDVVIARTGLGTVGHPGRDVLNRVCAVIKPLLNWDEARCVQEIAMVERRYQWD